MSQRAQVEKRAGERVRERTTADGARFRFAEPEVGRPHQARAELIIVAAFAQHLNQLGRLTTFELRGMSQGERERGAASVARARASQREPGEFTEFAGSNQSS